MNHVTHLNTTLQNRGLEPLIIHIHPLNPLPDSVEDVTEEQLIAYYEEIVRVQDKMKEEKEKMMTSSINGRITYRFIEDLVQDLGLFIRERFVIIQKGN
jgi:hypothetical protein